MWKDSITEWLWSWIVWDLILSPSVSVILGKLLHLDYSLPQFKVRKTMLTCKVCQVLCSACHIITAQEILATKPWGSCSLEPATMRCTCAPSRVSRQVMKASKKPCVLGCLHVKCWQGEITWIWHGTPKEHLQIWFYKHVLSPTRLQALGLWLE